MIPRLVLFGPVQVRLFGLVLPAMTRVSIILTIIDWREHRLGCPQLVHSANAVNNETIVYTDDAIRPVSCSWSSYELYSCGQSKSNKFDCSWSRSSYQAISRVIWQNLRPDQACTSSSVKSFIVRIMHAQSKLAVHSTAFCKWQFSLPI